MNIGRLYRLLLIARQRGDIAAVVMLQARLEKWAQVRARTGA